MASEPGAPTLDQLRIFLTIVDTGSFAAAARSLNRANSVISYALANLEAQKASTAEAGTRGGNSAFSWDFATVKRDGDASSHSVDWTPVPRRRSQHQLPNVLVNRLFGSGEIGLSQPPPTTP